MLLLCSCEFDSPISGTQSSEELIIDRDTIWQPDAGPVVVNQDVLVLGGATLLIRPGTVVQLIPGSVRVPDPAGDIWRSPRIVIQGVLVCDGLPDSLILFTNTQDTPFDRMMTIIGPDLSGRTSIAWSDIGMLEWRLGSPRIRHSRISNLMVEDCSDAVIDSNCCYRASIHRSGGVIRGNRFEHHLHCFMDSTRITGNIFQGSSTELWGGLTCAHYSRAIVERNLFDHCHLGILIFAGKPTINRNTFAGNTVNFSILPEYGRPEADTINATGNWWGTTDIQAIRSTIVFNENGGTISERTILIEPVAEGPIR